MAGISSSFVQLARVLLLPVLLGSGMGAIVKLLDESAMANNLGINDLGTYLGMWIVLTTVLSVSSKSQLLAALKVFLFFLGMVTAYYAVTRLLFGIFPLGYFLFWITIALLFAPFYAILAWYARQSNWMAALGVATPTGLLLWEAYSLRLRLPLHVTQFVFDIASAIILFLVLPNDNTQRVRVVALTPIVMVAVGIVNRMVPYVLGAL